MEFHRGEANLLRMLEFKKREAADPDFSPDFDVIVDMRNLIFDMSISDIEAFVDFNKNHSEIMGNRRNAVITNTPNQVVVTTLFKQMHNDLPQAFHIVSTLEAAMGWVHCSLTQKQVSAILSGLKEKAKQ